MVSINETIYLYGENTMKKSERVNDMMIYLNDKKTFHLKQIMERYHISKSTALRDIQSLEEIGMPIYSNPGRSGGYHILANRLLSPIVFTVDEVSALYFCMQTLHAYQSTPFHLSVDQLKHKFEGCIAPERRMKLQKMELIFHLGNAQNKSECNCLDQILQMAVEETVCEICYLKEESKVLYYVQFFDISSAYGQWYATAFNFKTNKPQVFRCDKVEWIQPSKHFQAKPLSQFQVCTKKLFQASDAIDFKIQVTKKGEDIFQKEHYPSMELVYEKESCYISGFYNKGEERFIASYFAAYGETILSIEPPCLKNLILERIDALKNHFSSL